MISFIIPFVTVEEDKFLNLNDGFDITDSSAIVYSTIKTIKNINSLKCEKEIILVDNSHTWPNLDLPNLKVIKGWQAVPLEELRHVPEFMNHFEIQDSLKQKDSDNRMFDNFGCDTQWAAMAFHQGIQESKGDYIVLQHNDTFYHGDRIDELIKHMEKNKLEYVSADNKKIWISTYLLYREQIDKYIKVFPTDIIRMSPEGGGFVQTQKIGFADAYVDLRPDIIVVLGDRYELLAASTAALFAKIPIAHIHGGDRTMAGIDEYIRHAITKISNLHFTATEKSKKRVIRLGENPKYVFFTGSPSIDEIVSNKITSKKELEKNII